MKLYSSNHFALTEIRKMGKKDIGGILCFEGLPSLYGSDKEVLALEDGVVLQAGQCPDRTMRDFRRGCVVTISGHNGVSITYGRLAHNLVERGEYVHCGQVIGIEGATGSGSEEYLTLEFRRNGRRVDGCGYLGIEQKPCEYHPPVCSPGDMVAELCGLTEGQRSSIDACPDSGEIWSRLLDKLNDSFYNGGTWLCRDGGTGRRGRA